MDITSIFTPLFFAVFFRFFLEFAMCICSPYMNGIDLPHVSIDANAMHRTNSCERQANNKYNNNNTRDEYNNDDHNNHNSSFITLCEIV